MHYINNKKASRNFLISTCYYMPFTSGTQTAAYTGFAVAIPFYAACIWPTRSCVCPVVYSFSSSMFTSLYTDTSPFHLAWSMAVIIVLCDTCFHTMQESYFITVSCLPVSGKYQPFPCFFGFLVIVYSADKPPQTFIFFCFWKTFKTEVKTPGKDLFLCRSAGTFKSVLCLSVQLVKACQLFIDKPERINYNFM